MFWESIKKTRKGKKIPEPGLVDRGALCVRLAVHARALALAALSYAGMRSRELDLAATTRPAPPCPAPPRPAQHAMLHAVRPTGALARSAFRFAIGCLAAACSGGRTHDTPCIQGSSVVQETSVYRRLTLWTCFVSYTLGLSRASDPANGPLVRSSIHWWVQRSIRALFSDTGGRILPRG